jgi:hypothetical protein
MMPFGSSGSLDGFGIRPLAVILQELGGTFERVRVWIGGGGIERRIDERRDFAQLYFTVRVALGHFEVGDQPVGIDLGYPPWAELRSA